VEGGFFDPAEEELNDWMRKSKDLGEEVRNQQKRRNNNEENADYS
jgi:hypothetical protein